MMDPYVNVKFSNQSFQGQVVKNGGKNPKFNDTSTFIVNSYFKTLGRCLELELMDKNIASDDVIGYGIIDLDPYLNVLQVKDPQLETKDSPNTSKPVKETLLRCFVNYDRKQAGFVQLLASFKEEKTDLVSFRFETAEFKRSTRTFGDMECYVRVTAGEEVLETKKSKDTKTDKPVWKDEFLTFTCPTSLKEILIEVMDDGEVIGSVTMEKDTFLIDDTENEFVKDISYKRTLAGKLWFNSKKNANPLFKELNGDYKKKLPEPEKKPEDNKPEEKKEDKKEDNKPEEKKEDKKEDKPEEKPEEKKEEKK